MRLHEQQLIGKLAKVYTPLEGSTEYVEFSGLTLTEVRAAIREERARFKTKCGNSKNLIFTIYTSRLPAIRVPESEFIRILSGCGVDENSCLRPFYDDNDDGVTIHVVQSEGQMTEFQLIA